MPRLLVPALVVLVGLVTSPSLALARTPAKGKAPVEAPVAVDKAFGALLAGAVPEADLVLLLDAKALGRGVFELLDFVEGTPALAADPALLEQWKTGRVALMGGLEAVKATVGSDPLRDYDRIVATLRLLPEGGDHAAEFSVWVTGRLAPDFVNRVFPDLPKTTIGGVEATDLGANPDAGPMVAGFLAPDAFLLASPAVFERALTAKAAPKALFDRHPGLLAKAGPGFVVRLSLVPPAWLLQKVATDPDLAAFPLARGLQRLRVDLDQSLHVEVAARDDAAFESARFLLEGAREGLIGSRALLRSVTLLALSFDLDRVPDLPEGFKAVLADRKALQATLERFVGGAVLAVPEVKTAGRTVSLTVDRALLLGGLVPLGVAAAVGVPAYQAWRQKAEVQAVPPLPGNDPPGPADTSDDE